MKHLFPFVNLLLASCILFSCQKKKEEEEPAPVAETHLYQEYVLRIEKTDAGTIAKALFKTDNSAAPIALSGNASITFNGGTYWSNDNNLYEWGKPGYVDVTFLLTKNNGSTFENILLVSDTSDIAIPSSFTVVSKSTATTFTWTGKPLGTNEEVYVYLVQGSIGSDTVRISGTGATSLPLSNNLSLFSTGTADLYVIRKKELSLIHADGNAGGKRIYEVAVRKMVSVN